jgi:glycosyltransferase involved in cell wall biosynthesis
MHHTSPVFVSVIIPVYNDPVRLKTCLQVLAEQTYPNEAYEVIVVDNGSDESIEPIVAEFSQVKR